MFIRDFRMIYKSVLFGSFNFDKQSSKFRGESACVVPLTKWKLLNLVSFVFGCVEAQIHLWMILLCDQWSEVIGCGK